MDQPSDDRDRGIPALRVAGVGLGLLGATFGVAGWFTLAPAPTAAAAVVATHSGSPAGWVRDASGLPGNARAHTRTGGA